MKLLLDMNLPPTLADELRHQGLENRHWSETGSPSASDDEIARYARTEVWVVVTHDLDFSAILAATRQNGPSVILIRSRDLLGAPLSELIREVVLQFSSELNAGALISLTAETRRVRLLPLQREPI